MNLVLNAVATDNMMSVNDESQFTNEVSPLEKIKYHNTFINELSNAWQNQQNDLTAYICTYALVLCQFYYSLSFLCLFNSIKLWERSGSAPFYTSTKHFEA